MRNTAVWLSTGFCAAALLVACAVGSGADVSGSDPTSPPTPTATSTGTSQGSSGGTPASSNDKDAATSGGKGEKDADVAETTPPPSSSCPGYAAPSEAATCKCASGKTCDANNCYGGYYCDLGVTPNKCVAKPTSCP